MFPPSHHKSVRNIPTAIAPGYQCFTEISEFSADEFVISNSNSGGPSSAAKRINGRLQHSYSSPITLLNNTDTLTADAYNFHCLGEL